MAGRVTLDSALPQILVGVDDSEFYWHHRLLVVDLGSGKWIAVSPDLEPEVLDLTSKQLIPLKRNSPFPGRAQQNGTYVFDPPSADEWGQMLSDAEAFARIMGVTSPKVTVPSLGVWRFSDTAADNFDEIVDPALLTTDGANCVLRGSVGLLRRKVDDNDEIWTTIEKVAEPKHPAWLDGKRSGPGRDLRIASLEYLGGRRHAPLATSLAAFRPHPQKDWPFRGPCATVEMLSGIRQAGHEIATYDAFWAQRAGIPRNSAVAHAHRNVCSALSFLQAYDQLDVSNCAAAEFLGRWALMIEAAVRKNPKVPSFQGLESYLSHATDENGGVITAEFTKFIADEQKSEAQVLKQMRLHSEEQAASARSDQGGGGGKQNKKKKPDGSPAEDGGADR